MSKASRTVDSQAWRGGRVSGGARAIPENSVRRPATCLEAEAKNSGTGTASFPEVTTACGVASVTNGFGVRIPPSAGVGVKLVRSVQKNSDNPGSSARRLKRASAGVCCDESG